MSTSRINQVWPTELKERVRELVGQRGLTDFTIEAVEEKLARELGEEPIDEVVPEPEGSSVEERLVEAPALDLPTLQAQYGIVLASELSKPVEAEVAKCENCGAALVDGECWACTF